MNSKAPTPLQDLRDSISALSEQFGGMTDENKREFLLLHEGQRLMRDDLRNTGAKVDSLSDQVTAVMHRLAKCKVCAEQVGATEDVA